MQRGAHLDATGKILKVRTARFDENNSVAVIDFRITNPTNYPFMADTVAISIEDSAGKRTAGETIPDIDATRMIEGIPALGPKYNDTLATRDKVGPHSTVDRMASASFEMPESKLWTQEADLANTGDRWKRGGRASG